jgi:hypothetical protein
MDPLAYPLTINERLLRLSPSENQLFEWPQVRREIFWSYAIGFYNSSDTGCQTTRYLLANRRGYCGKISVAGTSSTLSGKPGVSSFG